MALTLSTSGITNSGTIQAGHVSQSIDALKGTHAYSLTPSGSIDISGSLNYVCKIKNISLDGTSLSVTNVTAQSSGTTFVINNLPNDSTSNTIRLDFSTAAGRAGTHYKFLIGQVGSTASSPEAMVRPLTFKGATEILPRIDAGSTLYTADSPVNQIVIAAETFQTGDSFEIICDGTYWHLTGRKRIAGGIS